MSNALEPGWKQAAEGRDAADPRERPRATEDGNYYLVTDSVPMFLSVLRIYERGKGKKKDAWVCCWNLEACTFYGIY